MCVVCVCVCVCVRERTETEDREKGGGGWGGVNLSNQQALAYEDMFMLESSAKATAHVMWDDDRRFWLSSKEHLNVNFNPASLLSFGDLLAFVNSVLSVVPSAPSVGLTPSNSGASINTLVRQGKWTAPEAGSRHARTACCGG